MEHLEAAISEVEQKVKLGEITKEQAAEVIQKLVTLSARLSRLEEKLGAYRTDQP